MDLAEFQVPPSPSAVDLSQYDPASRAGFGGKHECRKALSDDVERLSALHDVFAASKEYALLLVLQGMDTAGKDGIIKHVLTGVNPQGIDVQSFRQPSPEELLHDYLWRENKALPERGRMAIFNRSYYEEVLILRVRPSLLSNEGLSDDGALSWAERYDDINAFERHLVRCKTIVVKCFLHISREEQRKRLLKRLETPEKMWKASDSDLEGHEQWDAYTAAYQAMLASTSTPWAPWYIIPADRKPVARAVVGALLVQTLQHLNLHYPEVSPERRTLFAKLATLMSS